MTLEFSQGGAFNYAAIYEAAAQELDEELEAAANEAQESSDNNSTTTTTTNQLYNLNAILDAITDD